MSDGRTWRRDEPIPPVNQVISVAHYGEDQIEQEITRLKGGRADQQLAEAANAWLNAREKLEDVQDTLRRAGEQLAQAWSSRAAVASQRALMLMHDTAGDLASTAHYVSDYTGTSAQLMRHMLDSAPSGDDPGPAESFAGDVGAAYGQASPLGLMPGVDSSTLSDIGRSVYEKPGAMVDSVAGALGIGDDRTAEYQAALERLNQGYVAENWRMPSRVTAELPLIGDYFEKRGRVPIRPVPGDEESVPGAAYVPSPDAPGPAPGAGAGLTPTRMETPVAGAGIAPGPPSTATTGELGDVNDYPGTSGGLAGAGSGPSPSMPGAGGVGPGAGNPGPGNVGGGGSAPVGIGSSVGGAGGVGARPGMGGGVIPTGAGGTNGGTRRGTGGGGTSPGAAGRAGASNAASSGRVPGSRAGMGGMMPIGAGGRAGNEDGASHHTWLVEDESPFTADEVEDLPGVIR